MRIAIVKLSALGDIVHAMVVLQFIKKFNKDILIDWFVEEQYKDLLEAHPYINKVHLVNIQKAKKKKSLIDLIGEFKKVRKLSNYDLVIDMQGLIKSAVFSKLIPSTKTLGFDKFSTREKLASFFYNQTFNCPYNKNIIERNIELIEFALGLSVSKKELQNKDPILFPKKYQSETTLFKTKKNILLIPGASHKSKCYLPSKLAKLTKLIDGNFLVVWGNQKERILADRIKELSPNVTIMNKLSISSLMLLISEVDLVIGSDTGPAHMAWASNTASIILFGSTPGYRNALVTNINKIIESESIVNPLKIDKKDYSVNNIKEYDIANLAKDLL